MSAAVIRFPPRRFAAIWILPLAESGWLVLHGAHGWLHGDYGAAIADAQWLARNTGLPIRDPQWGRA
jgi:hypothetical protein